MQYIFVIGGVCSSIGKGLFSASLAKLLEARNFKINILKLDPYFNVDPGTMSPLEHGEVFVTEDGRETDLDLGHYYRFTTNCVLSAASNVTAGQIFKSILEKERQGVFLGKTIQMFPHISNEIQEKIINAGIGSDILIVEIGGTVGDTEQDCFLRAINQFGKNYKNCINVYLSYLLFLKCNKEWKTKPLQHSIENLRKTGLSPDIVICRTEHSCGLEVLDRVSKTCCIARNCVFEQEDLLNSIYDLPNEIYNKKIDAKVLELLNLSNSKPNMEIWNKVVNNILHNTKYTVTIGIVGKYTQNGDAYKSIVESLIHACGHLQAKLNLKFICAEEDDLWTNADSCDAIIVPGGFGIRGWLGKIKTANICRINKKPFLGICLGMQALCVEYAQNVCEIKNADSTEMNSNCFPIVDLLLNQVEQKGGTMRLGSHKCDLKPNTKIAELYQQNQIVETHRHRYEMIYTNLDGLIISGINPDLNVVETVEIANHPFMIGVQFHPEFRSKLDKPHPLFLGLISAALRNI